ncbi:MAG: O-acetyl-ADP-ribose deacetylase [Firmicutes bacterium]|nr:O-acetyl-ADP-ribose deacetylase [Bacillota bacterium]
MEIHKISVIQGDITKQHVDAIVNAANNTLLGGGGVDGAIHRAAGPRLLEECKLIGGCKTGDAVITLGYRLPANWVIHTVGPVWRGGTHGEAGLLANCYKNSLRLVVKHNIHTVAFPSISTGAYNYPVNDASYIAVKTVAAFLKTNPSIQEIRFVCFNNATYSAYMHALNKYRQEI